MTAQAGRQRFAAHVVHWTFHPTSVDAGVFMIPEWIAETEFDCVPAQGERFAFVVRLGLPEKLPASFLPLPSFVELTTRGKAKPEPG